MEQRFVGSSGLRVSRLGLGTMGWSSAEDAAEHLKFFLDVGGNWLDTASVYPAAIDTLAALLNGHVDRSDIILCVRGGVRLADSMGGGARVDTSKRALLNSLDATLDALGTDAIDLWLVPGYSQHVPVEETLSALEYAHTSGRTRYVGLSNYSGWQSAQVATMAQERNLSGLVAHEVEYSLMERGIEREVLPAASALGMGVLAWAPLGRGVLTGKYRNGTPRDSRAASQDLAAFVAPYLAPHRQGLVDALCTAADGLGRTPGEVALAWVRDRPGVSSAIVGARTVQQLQAALAAEDLVLPDEISVALHEISAPVIGYPERR